MMISTSDIPRRVTKEFQRLLTAPPKVITHYQFADDGSEATEDDYYLWTGYQELRQIQKRKEQAEKEKRARVDEIKQAIRELKEEGFEF
jgi:hypothetical protein